jgi:cyclophilin family peptidyl-prolyl cis-trans isomerase
MVLTNKQTNEQTGSGPNSRDSQMFISYGANPGLGKELWETPFGEVIEGMEHVENFYSYGKSVLELFC